MVIFRFAAWLTAEKACLIGRFFYIKNPHISARVKNAIVKIYLCEVTNYFVISLPVKYLFLALIHILYLNGFNLKANK